MPRSPEWFRQVPQIIQQLAASTELVLDRTCMETLFRVRRRRAIQLMIEFGARRCGKALIVEREPLLACLRGLSKDPHFRRDFRRRRTLGARIEQLHEAWQAHSLLLQPASLPPHGAMPPGGIDFQPGRLQIDFETPVDLLQRLYDLAAFAARDLDAFEELVTSSLPR